MSHDARKPVLRGFLTMSDINRPVQSRKKARSSKFKMYRDCVTCTCEHNAVNAQLICIFVFAHAESRFSHDAAHMPQSLEMSRHMGKPTICLGENKGVDQLRSNCEADQLLRS